METLLSIFAEIDDPRDHTVQYTLSAMLFIALAATLCGATACTEIADYTAANLTELSEIVDLPGRTPSHDSFSRLFRLIDPDQLEQVLQRFVQAIRQALGFGPASGVVAVDAKRMRRGYERGRACVPPCRGAAPILCSSACQPTTPQGSVRSRAWRTRQRSS